MLKPMHNPPTHTHSVLEFIVFSDCHLFQTTSLPLPSLSDLLNTIFIGPHFKTFPGPDLVVPPIILFITWEMFFFPFLTEQLKLYHPQKAFPEYLGISLGLQHTQIPFHLFVISISIIPLQIYSYLFSIQSKFKNCFRTRRNLSNHLIQTPDQFAQLCLHRVPAR